MTESALLDDGFAAVFVIDALPQHVWASLRERFGDANDVDLPGFPSSQGAGPSERRGGCRAFIETMQPGQLLTCRKACPPFADTLITIRMEPANASGWPTRINLQQTGFGAALKVMNEVLEADWRQIVADFRVFLERGIDVPSQAPAPDLGATVRQTPTGLEVAAVAGHGLAHRCGLQIGDLLLTVAGTRVLDIALLRAMLAPAKVGTIIEVTWARASTLMAGRGEVQS